MIHHLFVGMLVKIGTHETRIATFKVVDSLVVVVFTDGTELSGHLFYEALGI